MRSSDNLLFRRIFRALQMSLLLGVFGFLILAIELGCTQGCSPLSPTYKMTGCQGDTSCKLVQFNCNIELTCKKSVKCSGKQVDQNIYLSCSTLDAHKLDAVATLNPDGLLMVFSLPNKETCQATLKP